MKALFCFGSSVMVLCGCHPMAKNMVFVQGGSFQMGNIFDGGDPDERPVHEVELSSFWIGKHEVTIGEFGEFVTAAGYMTTAEERGGCTVFVGPKAEKRPDADWRNVYFEQNKHHPVTCVSWYDAVEYCNWRSRNEGFEPCYKGQGDDITCDFGANGYRLPTEAEWEYAARSGGKPYKYAWGNGDPYIDGKPAGNTKDEAAKREFGVQKIWHGYDDGYAYTAPVGRFAPNELGIYDISGNVYEWCWDWYDEKYYENCPVQGPTGPTGGTIRACRDVGFSCSIIHECVASRGKGKPTLTFSWGGFRTARSVR
ncbi:MAG: formylglycine-generating enzyme family protein [Planctomycetota bacterium]|jgi:formylglycine-generating enzyme required for sulfatase activity